MQLVYRKYLGLVLLLSAMVIAIAAVAIYFSVSVTPDAEDVISSTSTPTPTVAASPTQSTVSSVSPISPLSPVSVISATASPKQTTLDTMFDTGRQAYENGDYVTAEEIFGEMLALNPRSARAYDARGTVHTTLNDFDSALDDYTKAIGVDPLYPPAYYNRGRVYGQLRRYDEALADIERAVELAPLFFGYRAYGNIGLIHHQRGEYDEALEAFAKSMSYDDGNADVYYYRGQTYTALENYDAAIADYQAAIDRFSSYADAYQGLGYAYYKSGQYDQALENLNQALTISPQSPSSRLYLALIYVTADELEIAGREVSQATDHLAELPEDERELILNRVLSELEILAQEQPDRASAIAEIIGSLPDSN